MPFRCEELVRQKEIQFRHIKGQAPYVFTGEVTLQILTPINIRCDLPDIFGFGFPLPQIELNKPLCCIKENLATSKGSMMTDTTFDLTYDTITKSCGDAPDWKIAAIENTGGSITDLNTALSWIQGESDFMDQEHRPLAGVSMEIYEILTADEIEEGDQWQDFW